MGLDMWAARRTYVKQWDHQTPEERYEVQVTRGGKPVEGIDPSRISYIEEEVMTWRKANQIHHWFVENVQDGNDNCADYYVSEDNLRELLSVCEAVIEASELIDGEVKTGVRYDKEHPNGLQMKEPGKVIKDPTIAEKLLPNVPGFFFGSQEYDQYYLEDVIATRDWIIRELADWEKNPFSDLHYSSSW